MLVAITGLPGNGKTLYALQFVKAWAEKENRPVFYHGIKGLALEVTKSDGSPGNTTVPWARLGVTTEKINGADVDVPKWWEAPTGAIVLIDEAQMCGFGVRGRGQTPIWAQKLETHRHLGLDAVLVTQQPSLLDTHDRALVERHFHVVRKFGMQRATVHEYKTGIKDNVNKNRAGSIRHEWKFPKQAFAWYVSAEAHTHRRHIPARVWVFIALPFIIGAIAWLAWTRFLDPKRFDKSPAAAAAAASAPVRATTTSSGTGKLSTHDYLASFAPRVPDLAYTAPVYDDVTKPVEAPYPAACVSMARRCSCFTQQGTAIEVSRDLCLRIVVGGFFIAWKQPDRPQPIRQEVRQIEPQAPIAAPSGFAFTKAEPKPSASILTTTPTESLPLGRGRNLPPSSRPSSVTN